MKILFVVLMSIFSLAAAQPARTQRKPAPAKEAPKIEIPAGAVKSEDGSYRYTDSKSKKQIYRKPPFGIPRSQDQPVKPTPPETLKNVKATEDGDSVRFQRPGPFGTYKWQRKKSELNHMEQEVWDRE